MFVSPDRDVDPVGNPAIRVARSRKVQKGEDKAFETPDARWVATRVEGSGKTINNDNASNTVHFSAFGLFDGHGGKEASSFCALHFQTQVAPVAQAVRRPPRDAR